MAEEEIQLSCFTSEISTAIQKVWKDPAVQKLYERRSEINLNDSSKYFLENLSNINRLDFVPTPRDLIMSYVPTVGVQNVVFSAGNRVFQLFDIGGLRIDRRKWATMYDGIDAIFFCIAISEYDQVMVEDPETNRLQDSLSLLEKISNEPKFKNTPLFLFLNEIDVFREKLPLIPLENYLSEYKGRSVQEALDFIESLARQSLAGRDQAVIHIYRTCMIDTEQMSKILESAFQTILSAA
ncbi:g-protein alpha subunit [Dictyocaulus viviparus]|uniref:G-protein alpha subunit n=1 Tax=Dictyocaulus viviparus TaxID=29172 RepID=A0A0D8XXA4_DICVI|nr:g-protein alpha subunit [Dictyocaulus viviparus]